MVSMLTRSAHVWEVPHGMSKRGLGAMLLAVLILASSCGGGGDGAPRVTLTDKSCKYSGARTHEPGVFDIEAENTTSHLASFAVYELAPVLDQGCAGFLSASDGRSTAARRMFKPPKPDDFRRNEAWSHHRPTSNDAPPSQRVRWETRDRVHETLGRYPTIGGVWPVPAAVYVPHLLEIR